MGYGSSRRTETDYAQADRDTIALLRRAAQQSHRDPISTEIQVDEESIVRLDEREDASPEPSP